MKHTKITSMFVAALALAACGGSGSSAPTSIGTESTVPTTDSSPGGTTATTEATTTDVGSTNVGS
ncbi:MAG TPA: hypothetical protein VHN36_20455, partial [Ilumatobacteraceae bacterium]|nr:hypothetical protein [Ilumatobacteraceae bacterium]